MVTAREPQVPDRMLESLLRSVVVQERAPEPHASAKATWWSMSTSAGLVQVRPSADLEQE
ncbi:hypothetical protein ASG91_00675 [Phycicoccus sp. Soil802]|nr:hypothetical protein ASG91_00675 [Phycicoccus sp. Soil802]